MRLNLFNYIGGKFYLTDAIISHLYYNTKVYIELFGGSGKVLLNKPLHKIELFNDINDDIYNLFSVIRNRKNEFLERLDYVIYSEKFFYEIKDDKPVDDIERAIRTFCIMNMSFSANGKSLSYCYDNIDAIYNRIKNVTFLNRDYSKILKSIKNDKDFCLYVDPPYFGTELYYGGEFTKEDHTKLSWWLNNINHKVVLSYYYFPEIETLYPKDKWYYHEYKVEKRGLNKKVNNESIKCTELIITNFKQDKVSKKEGELICSDGLLESY